MSGSANAPKHRNLSPGELWLFIGTIAIAGLATIFILAV